MIGHRMINTQWGANKSRNRKQSWLTVEKTQRQIRQGYTNMHNMGFRRTMKSSIPLKNSRSLIAKIPSLPHPNTRVVFLRGEFDKHMSIIKQRNKNFFKNIPRGTTKRKHTKQARFKRSDHGFYFHRWEEDSRLTTM